SSLRSPLINGKVNKVLVLTGCPNPNGFDRGDRIYAATVTKQLELIREDNYQIITPFHEGGLSHLIQGLINLYLDGTAKKDGKRHKPGVSPEVLSKLGRHKVEKPHEIVQITAGALTGIGEVMAVAIAKKVQSIEDLVDGFRSMGSDFLSEIVTDGDRGRRIGEIASRMVYNGVMRAGIKHFQRLKREEDEAGDGAEDADPKQKKQKQKKQRVSEPL
ncbi:MAG: hypothetical protein OK454_05365, partial [Thaumarchaeota archaeon]|nr:hypothetical protein [Nitrososphaerota archaeon]